MVPLELIRKHVESLYDGKCTITEFRSQEGLINNTVPMVIGENIPCRLSYHSFPSGKQTDTATVASQSIKLFLSPEIEVKAGCEIVVTQNGVTTAYKASGAPAIFVSHKEIELTLKDGWM
ncbi:hypothetical protein [Anaerotignum sp.]|uniref:hypothetical protein n=1 Tax=Anaerotignum sp. TaxID=2039241 RepID=UPI0028A177C0|nr:hypothetical protein [Anaerotignum sp.]